MSSLKRVLKQVKTQLEQKERRRQDAQDSMRKATSLSKQSILHVHQKRYSEARKLIEKAKETIVELEKTSQTCPEIVQGGLFDAARQEYSEANILLSLVEESRFATPTEIRVPPMDYVLGLADVIGEYRRLALDALREGDVKKGGNCLQTMDNIYVELMALDEAYTLVPGLRRKCDIARKIIEATRGDITQEVGRNSLEKHLRQLERTVERARQEQRANH
jgi:translin